MFFVLFIFIVFDPFCLINFEFLLFFMFNMFLALFFVYFWVNLVRSKSGQIFKALFGLSIFFIKGFFA
jgi:hypothetical protein